MSDGWWVVIVVTAFVVFANVGLMITALRSRNSRPDPPFRGSIADMLNPWKAEDESLESLREGVEALEKKPDE
ncbi:MAG: hypothetical protein PVF85_08830 [Anaerolineales bacterium]